MYRRGANCEGTQTLNRMGEVYAVIDSEERERTTDQNFGCGEAERRLVIQDQYTIIGH